MIHNYIIKFVKYEGNSNSFIKPTENLRFAQCCEMMDRKNTELYILKAIFNVSCIAEKKYFNRIKYILNIKVIRLTKINDLLFS